MPHDSTSDRSGREEEAHEHLNVDGRDSGLECEGCLQPCGLCIGPQPTLLPQLLLTLRSEAFGSLAKRSLVLGVLHEISGIRLSPSAPEGSTIPHLTVASCSSSFSSEGSSATRFRSFPRTFRFLKSAAPSLMIRWRNGMAHWKDHFLLYL